MVRKAKNLVKKKGILSTPNPKPGHILAKETMNVMRLVRYCLAKKDFVSFKQEEKQVHVQNRLILSNLKEVYQLFKERFPTESIGFSKFPKLCPKHCV